MNLREFNRFYLLKTLFGLIVLQLLFFFWLQKRNHRPIAVNDEVTVYEGHSVKVQPLRNDSDKDENEIAIDSIFTPLHGKISRKENTVFYSAVIGFAGIDSFAYTINDGKKKSRKAFIKVNVEKNLAPVAHHDNLQCYSGNSLVIAPMGNDEDREGDSIFIHDFTQPLHGSVTMQGDLFVYAPGKNYSPNDSFRYTITDGRNLSAEATISINILNRNDPRFPWLFQDVGKPSLPGEMSISGSIMVIKASGDDIWNNKDNFHYSYQVIQGDFEIITRVISLDNTDQWAKAGIMARWSLTDVSKNVFLCVTSQNGISFHGRAEKNSNTLDINRAEGINAPYWLKLVRKGDVFNGFISADGIHWTDAGKTTMALPRNIYVGLAVTSHNDGVICTAKFGGSKLKVL
jgi:hypothetical protein